MSDRFSGLWPATLTPLTATGEVNLPMIDQLVELFVSQKMGGLYVTGSTGQWPVLGNERRRTIVERTIQASAGRIPVMVHVGAMSTAESVELAQQAASAGADAISSVGPPYYSYNADAVFEHYRQIGAATDLPLYIYHFANLSQMAISSDEYVQRLLKLPNIAGMKYTDMNLNQLSLLQVAAHGRLRFFSGADEMLCHSVLCGVVGAIGTFYNLFGPVCLSQRNAFVKGNVQGATEFMLVFQSAIALVLRSGGVFKFMRAAMRLKYGMEIGAPLAPLGVGERDWSDDEVAKIIASVDGCQC
ncbi:MAG: dihydrodipicolinate synthase family protein [Planctomycetota bacterium]|nr:dihydrodipicolinate synthase family protein [Planctomycetota bacterium]